MSIPVYGEKGLPFTTQSWLLMALIEKPFQNIVEKGEKAGNQHCRLNSFPNDTF